MAPYLEESAHSEPEIVHLEPWDFEPKPACALGPNDFVGSALRSKQGKQGLFATLVEAEEKRSHHYRLWSFV